MTKDEFYKLGANDDTTYVVYKDVKHWVISKQYEEGIIRILSDGSDMSLSTYVRFENCTLPI